jgi:hypothetical protein
MYTLSHLYFRLSRQMIKLYSADLVRLLAAPLSHTLHTFSGSRRDSKENRVFWGRILYVSHVDQRGWFSGPQVLGQLLVVCTVPSIATLIWNAWCGQFEPQIADPLKRSSTHWKFKSVLSMASEDCVDSKHVWYVADEILVVQWCCIWKLWCMSRVIAAPRWMGSTSPLDLVMA